MEAERLTSLDDLCRWMRTNNVRRAKLGDMELEFERTPVLPQTEREPARLKSAEELEADRREERRRRYAMELGHPVSDEMLARLP